LIDFLIELIQSICLIVAAIIILISAYGILRLNDDMDKVIYVRIHMFGMVDIAAVLAMIGLGEFLMAGVYFLLAPFLAHAMANAYYYGEDEHKYEINDELTGKIDDNIYNKLAVDEITTIDLNYKSNFESKIDSNVSSTSTTSSVSSNSTSENNTDKSTNDENSSHGVVIKEVSTDDIENSRHDEEEKEA
jgi:energy-converting hydrogenase B subunit C